MSSFTEGGGPGGALLQQQVGTAWVHFKALAQHHQLSLIELAAAIITEVVELIPQSIVSFDKAIVIVPYCYILQVKEAA